ncbi:eukaryotic translation initiation factor 3 subunit I-like [Corticium candelabrum]|uniref:eukaryotic translation initiation factor 3 subunit I-like n=1 Tax=Corticium candelabrum TaxID=121492 RepID=UPI002E25D4A9|nr:eukaryotic translation initiation factor 3 subunit I-like [Corticium candelabrum]
MKPLMLHGHERSITQIKYNRDGDLLFSVAKDSTPTVWYSLNGERLGTYDGHSGALWCIDVTLDTRLVLTGSADNTCRLWDCETGRQISVFETKTAVRSCGFASSSELIFITTDKQMGHECEIMMFDMSSGGLVSPIQSTPVTDSRVTAGLWGLDDSLIITGHENGEVRHYNPRTGEKLRTVKKHTKSITNLQLSKDQTMLIAASKDTTAKLFDADTLHHLKTYKTERPVNSATISPIKDHVILGGGQEAMDVTTTTSRVGKFDARFFHLVFEEEIGRVKGHFGPINSLAFHPDGKSYSSGGEDGYVRIHNFDTSYFGFEFEY